MVPWVVQHLPEITLSLTVFEMTFSISAKIQDGGQKSEESKIFRSPTGVVTSTLGDPKFSRNRSISYSFRDKQHFPFPPKFKMADENRKTLKFLEVLEE